MITFDRVSREYFVQGYKRKTIKELFEYRKKRHQGERIFRAVDNVSFHIAAGQAVGVLGRNGAGKSTLLKLLTRIIPPTGGKIIVDGTMSCLLEVGAGFHHELSGVENIYLSGSILGMNRKEIDMQINNIIDFSEIRDFIYEPVKYYSSGMYLRLAFAIGVHLESDILVIDEALSVGDSNFQRKCLDKIKEVKDRGKTIFFVSHDINQVASICDFCLVMEKGRLFFQGNTSDAVNIYNEICS